MGNGDTLFGYHTTFAPTPEAPLHIYPTSVLRGFPETTGTTQTGIISRFGGNGTNSILDLGSNSTSGVWFQHTNRANLSLNYPILLNPNGGNIGVGSSAATATVQIHKPTDANNYLKFTNNDTGAAVGDGLDIGLTTTEKAIVWNYESTAMDFATNDVMRMSISSGGTVSTIFDMTVNSLTVGSGNYDNSNNTAFGYQVLNACLSAGTWNSGFGSGALAANTTGTYNTAVGHSSLLNNTIGGTNTSVGFASLGANISGNSNTSIGYGSLRYNVGGSSNIGIGTHAGRYATGSTELYIDNQDRSTNAVEKTNAIIYGVMAATPVNQYLYLNANVRALSLSATTYYGDGSNLTGIVSTSPPPYILWNI